MKACSKMCLVLVLAGSTDAIMQKQRAESTSAVNPIRKVVTMLQKMQTQVTKEGEEQTELYAKFACYCKTGATTLSASIQAAANKIESLQSALKSDAAKKEQAEADLKANQASRAEAKEAIAAATALREQEAAAFEKESSDSNANLAALTKAIAAIESGAYGAFVQTSSANLLRKFAMEKAELPDMDRQELVAFLSGSQSEGYVPQTGEITGILKTIKDEMAKGLADATAVEKTAADQYEGLMAAKRKEVAALTKQIEAGLTIIGDLGVSLASMANDLEDTQGSLSDDEKFLAELGTGCDTKAKEWEVIKATRAEELVALAETIKVLNDDDALELFKKTLPGASAFLQVQVRATEMRASALSIVRSALNAGRRSGALSARPQLDLIALALSGKQQGFEKVISMIDAMSALLKKEQTDDDDKKEYCEAQFDSTDDKKKALENSIADSETTIENTKGAIAALTEEIAALEADIKALDNSVADATDLRKKEHSDYEALVAADSTAKEVLLWAKNRLSKFYAPKMYKAPPGRELTDEQSVTVGMGGSLAPTPAPGGIAGTGIGASFAQRGSVAPPPPPETFGAYAKKGAESTGVLAMIDLLVADLDKELQESEVMETDAQKEYEEMMAESATKRADDAKSLGDKVSAKAAQEEALQAENEKKDGSSSELMATLEYTNSLHGECDWLLKFYVVRQSARNEEVEALGRAKAVLSGADYSLLETTDRRMRPVRVHA